MVYTGIFGNDDIRCGVRLEVIIVKKMMCSRFLNLQKISGFLIRTMIKILRFLTE